jgi:hypothetical protein
LFANASKADRSPFRDYEILMLFIGRLVFSVRAVHACTDDHKLVGFFLRLGFIVLTV